MTSYRSGRTYEEIYGPERAEEERQKRRVAHSTRGKTLEEILGPDRAETGRQRRQEARRGRTYEEIYGDRSSEERQKRSVAWVEKRSSRRFGYTYRLWQQAVRDRDKNTCRHCGKVDPLNDVHHIVPWREDETKRFDIDNGLTLCRSCHKKIEPSPIVYGRKPSEEVRKKMSDGQKRAWERRHGY